MLIEFSVGNYKSFKEIATLSLQATKLTSQDKSLDENTVFSVDEDVRLLTSTAIYGPNAGGKSNLVAALKFMRQFVLGSSKDTQAGEAIPAKPFALSPETRKQPSSFEVVFIADGRQYRYGFEVTPQAVTREWLYHVPEVKEARLFLREEGKITISTAFKEGKNLQEITRDNALFLSVVAQFNGAIAQRILAWFMRCDIISGLEDDLLSKQTIRLLEQPERVKEIVNFITSLDTGIADLKLKEQFKPGYLINPFDMTNIRDNANKIVNYSFLQVETIHRSFTTDGEEVAPETFNLEADESEGTKKIFALAGPVLEALQNGNPLIIDEFDARLHPLITRAIVHLFNSRETNPKHAQLIFLTHDTNLLDRTLLRRDQIWFIEKDRYGASHLYSLAEFKVRNDAGFERDYIRGKYGAIPFLGDFHLLMEGGDA